MFSASRDRLIKLWNINYATPKKGSKSGGQVDLLANLDGHTDWVNQIYWLSRADTLISCSNDTTIKIWKMYPLE